MRRHRGRTASYPAAPAQIPACGFLAPGSSEILASAHPPRFGRTNRDAWFRANRSQSEWLGAHPLENTSLELNPFFASHRCCPIFIALKLRDSSDYEYSTNNVNMAGMVFVLKRKSLSEKLTVATLKAIQLAEALFKHAPRNLDLGGLSNWNDKPLFIVIAIAGIVNWCLN